MPRQSRITVVESDYDPNDSGAVAETEDSRTIPHSVPASEGTRARPMRQRRPPPRYSDETFEKSDPYDRCLSGYKWRRYTGDDEYHQPKRDSHEKAEEEILVSSIAQGRTLNRDGYLCDDFIIDDDDSEAEYSEDEDSEDEDYEEDTDEDSD